MAQEQQGDPGDLTATYSVVQKTGRFKCDLCAWRIGDEEQMKAHCEIKHLQCNVCKRYFAGPLGLRNHQIATRHLPGKKPKPWHGPGAYKRYGCRCEVCVTEYNANERKARRRRIRLVKRGEAPEFNHGKRGFFDWGCRCIVCVRAYRELYVKRKEKERSQQTGG